MCYSKLMEIPNTISTLSLAGKHACLIQFSILMSIHKIHIICIIWTYIYSIHIIHHVHKSFQMYDFFKMENSLYVFLW